MVPAVHDFASWRQAARGYLQAGLKPDDCAWPVHDAGQAGLFAPQMPLLLTPHAPKTFTIPPAFMDIAEKVACHVSPEKWHLLYSALWRLTQGEKHVLLLAHDPLIHRLMTMAHQVSRDAHKAKAFVRFRSLGTDSGREKFAAWHCPDHKILPLVAPFFQRRFGVMDWTIMTPQQSVSWNGRALIYGPGVPKEAAPADDAMEEVWLTFYRAIFNPARIKVKMMKQEMPVRYWHTMPETRIIPDLLQEAPARVEEMLRHQEGFSRSAAQFLPVEKSLAALSIAAKACEGCPLHCHATQTVFGQGREDAPLMIVGEQPGEQEDQSSVPFIGPAGKVLMQALEVAGITRDDVYMTNAVKHFKFTQSGKKRIHQSPNAREINACKPWLEAERTAVKPKIILGLGLTAAKSLLGHGFSMKEQRGKWFEAGDARILVTYHPSAVLRAGSKEQGEEIYRHICADAATARAAAIT